jgi:uncharacterized protein (DUF58 family)
VTRPSRDARVRSWAQGLATMLGIVGAFVAQGQRLPLVAVVCVAVALAPVLGLTNQPAMSFRHTWPKGLLCYVGDELTVTTTVTNSGPGPSSLQVVHASGTGVTLAPLAMPQLRPSERLSLDQQVHLAARRGPVVLTTSTRTQHRLVGYGKPRVLPLPKDVVGAMVPAVRPRPVMPPAALVDRMSRPSDEGRGTGRRGSADPLSLRHFAGGDPVSSVHWRSTARAGSPIVMDREELASGVLVLLVAGSQDGEAWEAAVARAAGMVQSAALGGVPVQVLAAAPSVAPPPGTNHEGVQDWLAGLTVAGPAQPDLVAAAVRAAAGGLVAVLSMEPSLSTAVAAAGATAGSIVDLASVTW